MVAITGSTELIYQQIYDFILLLLSMKRSTFSGVISTELR